MLDVLFDLRRQLDSHRQPRHAATVSALGATLHDIGLSHPYALADDQLAHLQASVSALGHVAAGREFPNATQSVLRISGVAVLRRILRWNYGALADNTRINAYSSDAAIYEALLARSLAEGDWLSLDRFAKGFVKNRRGFSWWTTWDGLQRQPFEGSRRLGLVDDWIPEHALLLRCDIRDLRVPSCVDGFDGPIFEASPESASHGRTIDLNGSAQPMPGEPEFVLPPISSDRIWLWPILIDRGRRASSTPVPEGDPTWRRVASYYRSLI